MIRIRIEVTDWLALSKEEWVVEEYNKGMMAWRNGEFDFGGIVKC